jgi:hypothetical protein
VFKRGSCTRSVVIMWKSSVIQFKNIFLDLKVGIHTVVSHN